MLDKCGYEYKLRGKTPQLICALVMLLLMVLLCELIPAIDAQTTSTAARVILESYSFDDETIPTTMTEFSSSDGIMVIDMWENSTCQIKSKEMNELAVKINTFLESVRPFGVRIFHGLSESSKTSDKRTYADRYWTKQDPGVATKGSKSLQVMGDRYLKKRIARLSSKQKKKKKKKQGKQQLNPSPLDIFPKLSPKVYCNDSYPRSPTRSYLLNSNIHFNRSTDIMFDSGYFFKQIASLRVKRLFYVGTLLNICVFHTRPQSSLMAMMSNQFDQVGIILDLTQPHMRVKVKQPGCENLNADQCAVEFGKWVHYRVRPPQSRKQKSLRFWRVV